MKAVPVHNFTAFHLLATPVPLKRRFVHLSRSNPVVFILIFAPHRGVTKTVPQAAPKGEGKGTGLIIFAAYEPRKRRPSKFMSKTMETNLRTNRASQTLKRIVILTTTPMMPLTSEVKGPETSKQ